MTPRGATTGGSAGATKQPACVMVRAERARGSEDLRENACRAHPEDITERDAGNQILWSTKTDPEPERVLA